MTLTPRLPLTDAERAEFNVRLSNLVLRVGEDELRRLLAVAAAAEALVEVLGERLDALGRANEKVRPWLSAALDDLTVCKEMKADIETWFKARDVYETKIMEGDHS